MKKLFDINQIDYVKMFQLHQTLQPQFCFHQLFNKSPDIHRFFEVNKNKTMEALEKEFDLAEGKILSTKLYYINAKLNGPGISLYVIAPYIIISFVPKELSELNEVQILCHDKADAKILDRLTTICKSNYVNEVFVNKAQSSLMRNYSNWLFGE